ncbi:membrane protein [Pyrenophora tritici-repentis]|uniref:ferric-chelate reductase (NADPH) n=2 Tax=Pyrenophora tritici-repentis TaxID=45151 RepID=A0A2W1DH21_9PLEO|nr:ferric reductase [Pyrenophora tritici-repentis Pt-1C-BFP]KAA8611715.1 Ferric reductase [Pyrenophora tritici-repentis]EDU48033.1 ferric reductase [Pyrenophora tritici-repentis Pt-1C-BFP]KAF7447382.1 Ferric reductase [Pyrenophora tritici-repentis]KAF7569753.1 ferric reductase [Pyrenophora tritici-repentis]KAG9382525.1 Ferric reductase [Pyrenophora tritici-repentis]
MDLSTTLGQSPSTDLPGPTNIHRNEPSPSHDPFKYSQGLAGVDQPSNYLFANILIATALLPAVLTLCFRVIIAAKNYRRQVSAMTSCKGQDFWKKDRHPYWGLLKRHFLYAPIRSDRSLNKTTKPSNTKPVDQVTLPQLAIIIIYFISNIAYCLAVPAQPTPQMVAAFRGRSGALATLNLILTVLFALRNNPFIYLLQVSYDTFNLFHRWMARLVVLESTAHISAFLYNTYHTTHDGAEGWKNIGWLLSQSSSFQCGLVGFLALILLMVHSIRLLRHPFYETFLTLHRIGIATAISGVYFHLAKHALPQLPWIYLVIALLVLEPSARVLLILRHNLSWEGRAWTRVSLEALPGDATRVTFALPRSWNAKPGSHVHIYLPRLSLLGSHPFSVAWSQSSGYAKIMSEELPSTIDDLRVEDGPSTVTCIVRSRQGMTQSLYKLALQTEKDQVHLWGAIEGPYGGHHSFDSYGTVVLFAGGVGITHQLSFIRHLLDAHNSNMAATQKIVLVWCVANLDALEWVQPWLDQIVTVPSFHEVVQIRLYVTRTTSPISHAMLLPTYLDVRQQRCQVQELLDEEVLAQIGAMAVSVCGPRGLSGSVRAAVRQRVRLRSIDFFEEAFSY